MAGVFLSKQYETPYYIAEVDKNIYSIEELSFFLYHYLPIVEREFFNDALVDYLEQILNMRVIAHRMYEYIHQRGSLTELVMLTVKASEYFSDTELVALQRKLEERKKTPTVQQMKEKAEAFVRLEKYGQAVETYRLCLKQAEDGKADEAILSEIFCGLGSVYGKMLRFEEAEEAYRQSMNILPNKDAQNKMVLLLLIQNRRDEVSSYLEEFQLSEPIVRECERQYGKARQIYIQTTPTKRLGLEQMKANYRKENGYH